MNAIVNTNILLHAKIKNVGGREPLLLIFRPVSERTSRHSPISVAIKATRHIWSFRRSPLLFFFIITLKERVFRISGFTVHCLVKYLYNLILN